MRKHRFLIPAGILLVIFCVSLFLGRYPTPGLQSPGTIATDPLFGKLLLHLRLPRLIAALLLGCGLAWVLDTYEIFQLPPEVYFVDRLPVALHAGDVILIYLTTVAVAFAATIYPALQGSRLEPVEAIRHE